jgi:hypothetical protein
LLNYALTVYGKMGETIHGGDKKKIKTDCCPLLRKIDKIIVKCKSRK